MFGYWHQEQKDLGSRTHERKCSMNTSAPCNAQSYFLSAFSFQCPPYDLLVVSGLDEDLPADLGDILVDAVEGLGI